jgi:hypothetical protein
VAVDPASLVDLDQDLDRHASGLRSNGVVIVPGFLRPDAVASLVAEADALATGAHHQDVQGTPYLERPDADRWPAGHPRRRESRSSVHTVAYDRFDAATSPLRALFEWDPLLDLVSTILGRRPLFRYADPLGAMNLAVMVDGDELGWHFDQTDFVVSIALQSSEAGGEFENVQQLRTEHDERYDVVAEVLRGDAPERVTTVPMTPGTLMLFEGRWSLHRVTTVKGPTPRYVALFGYDTKPGTMSSDVLRRVRYGRVA